jgi:hypothetical protein
MTTFFMLIRFYGSLLHYFPSVAQLVEALRYKPEGRGFDSKWGLWDSAALWPTQPLTEMSTRWYLGGKGGRCVRLTTLPPSCADCLEILGASTSWNRKDLSRPVIALTFTFY